MKARLKILILFLLFISLSLIQVQGENWYLERYCNFNFGDKCGFLVTTGFNCDNTNNLGSSTGTNCAVYQQLNLTLPFILNFTVDDNGDCYFNIGFNNQSNLAISTGALNFLRFYDYTDAIEWRKYSNSIQYSLPRTSNINQGTTSQVVFKMLSNYSAELYIDGVLQENTKIFHMNYTFPSDVIPYLYLETRYSDMPDIDDLYIYLWNSTVPPGNVSLGLITTMENTTNLSYLSTNLTFNFTGNFTGNYSTDMAYCTVFVNDKENSTMEYNLSLDNVFLHDLGFFEGSVNFSVNCSNAEVVAETGTFIYNLDNRVFYLKNKVDNLQTNEAIKMTNEILLGIPFLSLFIFYLAYSMFKKRDSVIAIMLFLLSSSFDLYYCSFLYSYILPTLTTQDWRSSFRYIFFISILTISLFKLFSPVLVSYRRTNREVNTE